MAKRHLTPWRRRHKPTSPKLFNWCVLQAHQKHHKITNVQGCSARGRLLPHKAKHTPPFVKARFARTVTNRPYVRRKRLTRPLGHFLPFTNGHRLCVFFACGKPVPLRSRPPSLNNVSPT